MKAVNKSLSIRTQIRGESMHLVLEGQKKKKKKCLAYIKGREDPSGWVEHMGGEI